MRAKKAFQSSSSSRRTIRVNTVNYAPHHQKRKLNKRRAILIGLGLAGVSAVSAAVGAFLAVALSTASPLQQAQLSNEEEKVFSKAETVSAKNLNLPELKRPVNILVLGIKVISSDLDERGIEYEKQDVGYLHLVNSFDGLSDSMLLVRFDPEADKVSVLSIPRDTRVYIEGHGVRKINHANQYGGPALSAAVASELLGGIKIDRYVRVNVQGVEKLIDTLGGVTVNVPKDMKYNDFSQHLYINLKKGVQHLDGDKAMQFLRYRYDGYGDISRVQRQQMLMRSAAEQTLKPATVIKIPKILSLIQSHLDTNLSVRELMALSNFASKTDRSNIQMMMLPGDFNSPEETVSYWLPDGDRIKKLMTQHFALTRKEEAVQRGLARQSAGEEFPKGEAKANLFRETSDRVAVRSKGMLSDVGDGGLPAQRLNQEVTANERSASLAAVRDVNHPRIRISVQNSTEDSQTLQSALDMLRNAGYRRVSASKNWQDSLAKTRVIAQSGDDEAAQEVRSILGVGEVVVESTGELNSDVTVQLGRDWERQLKLLIESDGRFQGNSRDNY